MLTLFYITNIMNKLSEIVIPVIETLGVSDNNESDLNAENKAKVKEINDLFYYILKNDSIQVAYNAVKFKELTGMTLTEYVTNVDNKIKNNIISAEEIKNIISNNKKDNKTLRLINLNTFLKRKSDFMLNTQIKKELKENNIKKVSISNKFLDSYKFNNEGYIFNYSNNFNLNYIISSSSVTKSKSFFEKRLKTYIENLDKDNYNCINYTLELEYNQLKQRRKVIEIYKDENGNDKFRLTSFFEKFITFPTAILDSIIKLVESDKYDLNKNNNVIELKILIKNLLRNFLIEIGNLNNIVDSIININTITDLDKRKKVYNDINEYINNHNNYITIDFKHFKYLKCILNNLNDKYDNVTDYENYRFILSISSSILTNNYWSDNLQIVHKMLTDDSETFDIDSKLRIIARVANNKTIVLNFIKKHYKIGKEIISGVYKIESENTGEQLKTYKYIKNTIKDYFINDFKLFDDNNVIYGEDLKYINDFIYRNTYNFTKILLSQNDAQLIDKNIKESKNKNPLSRLFLFNTVKNLKIALNKDIIEALFNDTNQYDVYPLNEISKIVNTPHTDKFKLTRLNSLFYKVKKTDLNNILLSNTQNFLDCFCFVFNINTLNVFLNDKNLFKYLNIANDTGYSFNKINAEVLLKELSVYIIKKYDVNATNIILIDIYNHFSKEEFKVIIQALALLDALSGPSYVRFTETTYSEYLRAFIIAVKSIIDLYKETNSTTGFKKINRKLYNYKSVDNYGSLDRNFYYLFNTHLKYF